MEVIKTERGSGGAQAFQAIIGAFFGQEDVDDEVDIVHQDPLALAAAFYRIGVGAVLPLQSKLDLIGDGHGLPVVGACADEEVVCETALGGIERENADIFRFLFIAGFGSRGKHLSGFDGRHDPPGCFYGSAAGFASASTVRGTCSKAGKI